MSSATGQLATNKRVFKKVLIANRGAIASKVIRVLKRLGIKSVAVYSDADKDSPYVQAADEAVCIGPAPARDSYLNIPKLLDVIRDFNVDAVHPGYGFLSENPDFAEQLQMIGVDFIGPSPRWLREMGHKTNARQFFAQRGLAVGGGSSVLDDSSESWISEARKVGYPVLIKPAAGGGGIGMIKADDDESLVNAVIKSKSLAAKAFGSGEVYLEKFVEKPRHIEFQILADRYGNAMHLHERDCSVQRRHQKVIEEAPAPLIAREALNGVADSVAKILSTAGYDSVGTVEMLWAPDGSFSFLEMNTRLQVEHAVTEAVYDVDILEAQIRLAQGELLDDVVPNYLRGGQVHAIEARIYAEDPAKHFFPSTGVLEVFELPSSGGGLEVETGYVQGQKVTPFYDPMLAKIIVKDKDRLSAISSLRQALQNINVVGVKTNKNAILQILDNSSYKSGYLHTKIIDEIFSS